MERPLRDRPTMHDLVLSKLEAGRQKDIDFARSAARLRLPESGGPRWRPSDDAGTVTQIS